MDLTQLHSQRQLSLILAARTTSRLERTKHLAKAELLANRISNFQPAECAATVAGWPNRSERAEFPDGSTKR